MTVYNILVRNRFEREAVATNALVQADLQVRHCTPQRTSDPTKPVVVSVEGQGFQSPDSGSLDFQADRAAVTKPYWQAHTKWEVQIDNANPSQPINVSKVAVTNKQQSNTFAIKDLVAAECKTIPAAN